MPIAPMATRPLFKPVDAHGEEVVQSRQADYRLPPRSAPDRKRAMLALTGSIAAIADKMSIIGRPQTVQYRAPARPNLRYRHGPAEAIDRIAYVGPKPFLPPLHREDPSFAELAVDSGEPEASASGQRQAFTIQESPSR
jgi:hypothetical protein